MMRKLTISFVILAALSLPALATDFFWDGSTANWDTAHWRTNGGTLTSRR